MWGGGEQGGVDVYSAPSASHDPVSHTRDSASAATPATCTLIAPQARSGSAPVVDLMHLGARAGSTLQVGKRSKETRYVAGWGV